MARFQIELIDARFVGIEPAQILRLAPEVGRPDGLVRFLRVAHLGLILARPGVELAAEDVSDDAGCLRQRLLAERRRVGAMVGDEAFVVQALRRTHRAVGREPQLAVGLLLKRRRGERRRRTLRDRPLFDVGHRPWQPSLKIGGQCAGIGFGQQADVVLFQPTGGRVEILARREPLRADANERGHELPAFARDTRLEVPVAGLAERAALLFALDDEPDRDALHATGAQPRLHLLPQDGRQRVAVEPVQDAAALLRFDEVLVQLVRRRERLTDRFLGDLMEDDAPRRDLRLEHLFEVRRDRFALAVRIGREQHLRSVLQGLLE